MVYDHGVKPYKERVGVVKGPVEDECTHIYGDGILSEKNGTSALIAGCYWDKREEYRRIYKETNESSIYETNCVTVINKFQFIFRVRPILSVLTHTLLALYLRPPLSGTLLYRHPLLSDKF